MDADNGRQAQLWWMFGVGLLLLVSAYYQKSRPLLAHSERGPAQVVPTESAGGLPSSEVQSR